MSTYFENGKSFPKYAKEIRKLIGKEIRYVRRQDTEPNRGLFFPQIGTVKEVSGKNVLIGSDWQWARRILEYEEIEVK